MSAAERAVAGRPRSPLVDILRGLALVVMAGYHVVWDLFYLGVYATDITVDPAWVTLQRSILGSFVFLAGASLVLAHGERIRWRSFWRREAILVAAALAVSAGTWFAFGPYFSFFGVIHAIALFSLLALPFLRAPLWLVAIVAALVIAATFLWSDPAFINPWLAWIGFWPIIPATVDIVSVVPWFGVMVAGVLVMRLVLASPLRRLLAARGGTIGGALAVVGRWSLVIYLLHQPLLYGVLSGLVSLFPPPPPVALTDAQEFAQSCQPSCTVTGTPAAYCTRYCSCALEAIAAANLWDALSAEFQTEAQQSQTSQVINLCRAMAEDAQ